MNNTKKSAMKAKLMKAIANMGNTEILTEKQQTVNMLKYGKRDEASDCRLALQMLFNSVR